MKKVGVWLTGARGTVATTVMAGALAVGRGLAGRWGLVTELPEFAPLALVGLERLVFGGWDVVSTRLAERVRVLTDEDRALPVHVSEALEGDLNFLERRIRPGFLGSDNPFASSPTICSDLPVNEPLEAAVERLGNDLERFRAEHGLETVIVINLASTEVPVVPTAEHERLEAFRRLIREDRRSAVGPSIIYAYAALDHGFPYVNFTPSVDVSLPALQELALGRRVPFYGCDGKTGETLLKTVLAPVFRSRNLEVLSWEGFNILGGGDGEVLGDAGHKRSKVRSKSAGLPATLGYQPHSGVFIEYVPSLGNWKTAWDFIHFRGFLGTKMSVQFIWQGSDAILAAPLVLDLARLTEFAHRCGESGPMTHLACFFKDPLGIEVQSFHEQFGLLMAYVEKHKRKKTVNGQKGGRGGPLTNDQ